MSDVKEILTLFLLFGSVVVAYFTWLSQLRMARAKNAIDLQNNIISTEKMQKNILQTVRLGRSALVDDLERLAKISGDLENSNIDEGDLEAIEHIRVTLNLLEGMANGIERKVYDEDILYSSYGHFLIMTYQNFFSYIMEKRKSNPHYYLSLSKLAREWKMRRKT